MFETIVTGDYKFYNEVNDKKRGIKVTNGRYSRQILFHNIGQQGQTLIAKAHILIIGMGALGTHVAEGLVRAGIGEITIIDRDYIEYSNLQSQTLFTEQDALEALPKAIAAEQALKQISSDVDIHAYVEHVTPATLEQYGHNITLIIDATDNFDTRRLINDFAYKQRIPWIYGGVVQSTYVEAVFNPGKTPCFNCLLPQLPAINMTCDTVGVIQPAVTMTTSLQIKDALKLIVGAEVDTKYTYGDVWSGEHHAFGFSKMHRKDCDTCGDHPQFTELTQANKQYATLCGRDTVQFDNPTISQEMLHQFLIAKAIPFKSNNYMIMFQYEGHRIISFQNGRLLIHGMTKPAQAATLVNKLFG